MSKGRPTPKQNKWNNPLFKLKMRANMTSLEDALNGKSSPQYIKECQRHGVKPWENTACS